MTRELTRERVYASAGNVEQDIKVNGFGDKAFQVDVEILRRAALALLDLREGIGMLARLKENADVSYTLAQREVLREEARMLRALLVPKSTTEGESDGK